MLEVILILLIIAILAFLDDGKDEEPDALDLARPSVERLQANAQRTLEELRALDSEGRE